MKSIPIGFDVKTGEQVRIPLSAFPTHFHLMGGTGKGKTTLLFTLLFYLLTNPFDLAAYFIFDRLGGFTQDLLLWMSSPFCPQYVRDRLVLIQPSRDGIVCPLNPLLYEGSSHGYFRVERATEIILRAWESMNIEAMPRLARWIFNSFWAAAQLGLTISDCAHFLLPGSPYHTTLLNLLPSRLKAEWEEITQARGQEATRILDSSRNRLKPYFESDILRRMFGSAKSQLNVERMMREGKIVIFDLSPHNRLSTHLSNTIGALILNEIIATVRNGFYQSYVFLDEFQNYVGPDLQAALPETRQRGLKLLLSHQFLSQLKRGDYDMTPTIFTPQSRIIFGVQGEDADMLANEVASVTFDPDRIKHEHYTRRQLINGHRLVTLHSSSHSQGYSDQQAESDSKQRGRSDGRSGRDLFFGDVHYQEGTSEGTGHGRTRTSGSSASTSEGEHETLVPQYDEFLELSSRTYRSFNEQRSIWARDIRNLPTGQALVRLVNEPAIRRVQIKRTAPGYLGLDSDTLRRHFPQALDRMHQLIEENFQSDYFAAASDIDREQDQRIRTLIAASHVGSPNVPPAPDSPFA